MENKKQRSYRLAFDVSYSDKLIGGIARKGHQIVCVAGHGETDEKWFSRAVENGAEIIFSRDSDIINLLAKRVGTKIRVINDQKNIMITSSPSFMDMFEEDYD